MSIKISSININNNPNKSLVRAKKIESEEKKLGHLLLLIEINDTSQLGNEIIEEISKSLKRNYFENYKMLLNDSLNSLKIEAFFESSLVKTTKDLYFYLDNKKINLNLNNLNISAILVYEGEVYISNFGKNKAYLLRKIKNEYEISDIDPEEDREKEGNNKIFSSIINGEIPNNSYIIISNPSLGEYILNKDFIDIIEKLNLEGAVEKIKLNLKDINNYSNFCGIILKNSILEEKMKNSNLLENNRETIKINNNLINSENSTEKLLNKSGSIDKKKIEKYLNKVINKINVFKKISKLIKIIKNKKANNKEQKINSEIFDKPNNKNKKTLLAILSVLLIVLFSSFYLVKKQDIKVEEENQISQVEELIKQKSGQIDSYLLYGDENNALIIINELKEEIDKLDNKEKDKIKDIQNIEKKLEEQLNQIRKMINFENPEELTNLNLLNNGFKAQSISISKNYIFIADNENSKIYSINTDDGLSSVLNESEKIKNNKIISLNKNDNSYLLNNNNLIEINNERKISYTGTDLNLENINSFDFYLNYLYVLDSSKKEVIRYSKSSNQYISPTTRLKINKAEDPIYMHINNLGSIYILNKSGVINKYHDGKEQAFNLDQIEPQVKNVNKFIITNNNIYIIEKEEKRIIKFKLENDNGLFLEQYYSDKFDNIQDFALSEDNSKIYILNNNLIYKIEI